MITNPELLEFIRENAFLKYDQSSSFFVKVNTNKSEVERSLNDQLSAVMNKAFLGLMDDKFDCSPLVGVMVVGVEYSYRLNHNNEMMREFIPTSEYTYELVFDNYDKESESKFKYFTPESTFDPHPIRFYLLNRRMR